MENISGKTKKVTYLGLLAALSLGIYALESALPPIFPIPGIKPGLSNIITLYVLRRFGKKESSLVLFMRIALAGLLFGSGISIVYSLAGGFGALLIEIIIDAATKKKHLYITGAFGGLIHNMCQLLTASVIMGSAYVFSYAPYLAISGIITGLFTGLAASYLLNIKIQ